MADGLKDIIARLEQQKAAIERALSALHEVEGVAAKPGPARKRAVSRPAKAKRKGGMTPEGRRRLSEALRQRWAAKKAAGLETLASKKAPRKRARRKKASAKAA